MAAARCSDSHVFAVPGTPSSSRARSVASVATATSIRRREPTYFGVIAVPSGAVPPSRYVVTAHGDSRQPGGRGRSSPAVSADSSAWYSCSACGRRTASPGSASTVVIVQLLQHLVAEAQYRGGVVDGGRGAPLRGGQGSGRAERGRGPPGQLTQRRGLGGRVGGPAGERRADQGGHPLLVVLGDGGLRPAGQDHRHQRGPPVAGRDGDDPPGGQAELLRPGAQRRG